MATNNTTLQVTYDAAYDAMGRAHNLAKIVLAEAQAAYRDDISDDEQPQAAAALLAAQMTEADIDSLCTAWLHATWISETA
jgi:hypothetical protein